MFAVLGSMPAKKICKGTILSMEGNCYIAPTIDSQGKIIERADKPFACISQARDWLKDHGTNNCDIQFEQSGVYSEMIGSQGFN